MTSYSDDEGVNSAALDEPQTELPPHADIPLDDEEELPPNHSEKEAALQEEWGRFAAKAREELGSILTTLLGRVFSLSSVQDVERLVLEAVSQNRHVSDETNVSEDARNLLHTVIFFFKNSKLEKIFAGNFNVKLYLHGCQHVLTTDAHQRFMSWRGVESSVHCMFWLLEEIRDLDFAFRVDSAQQALDKIRASWKEVVACRDGVKSKGIHEADLRAEGLRKSLGNTSLSDGKARPDELYHDDRIRPYNYKTKPCIFFMHSQCKKGPACTFSHDLSQVGQQGQPPLGGPSLLQQQGPPLLNQSVLHQGPPHPHQSSLIQPHIPQQDPMFQPGPMLQATQPIGPSTKLPGAPPFFRNEGWGRGSFGDQI